MTSVSSYLQVGGVSVDREKAREEARRYLSGQGGYGYPAYDAYDSGGGPRRLSDGDLLAPALLNVTVRLPAFYSLSAMRPHLEAWLADVPPDASLVEAGHSERSRLGDLFAVIDEGLPGVGGTTLAKIMHRKRPNFVPLYDRYVWRCYVGADPWPVPRARDRSWREFIGLLASAMIEDLRREHDWLTEVAALAVGPVRVTNLRALDILAWHAGRGLDVPGEAVEPEPEAPADGARPR